jgi:hypothetical protein
MYCIGSFARCYPVLLCQLRATLEQHKPNIAPVKATSHFLAICTQVSLVASSFFSISNIMAQLQLLEEHAFLQARVALNQYGPRRDQWRAFMNGPSWAFERCMRTQFVPIASRFCVICQMGINGL